MDGINDVTKEILAKWFAMDQTDTTTGSRTNESFQPSEHGQKFDVFLSHSGKQKNFVRQLHRDLTNQGVSCFFDQDHESLPVAENFPPRIFSAARTCKVAVLLLSKDFLESKWPMLELSAFVEARDKNPNLKILPLFFKISPGDLRNTKESDEKWKQLGISGEKRTEWQQALHAIGPINGLPFAEGGNEVNFRDEIVKVIWNILPTPSPRYHVLGMQGEARMCQELANFFNKVQPKEKGIPIAGLYGIAGQGKTTVGKAFCNFKLGDFAGKVCHLEFSRGNQFDRIKLALHYLTHRPESHVLPLTSQDQAQVEMYRRVKGQRVLLVLDNITEESIDEVLYYLKADLGENSWVLLSARSEDVLVKHFNIDSQSCMRVPRLEEEEAVAILLERAFLEESKITAEDRAFALRCAKRCLFKGTSCDIGPRARSFHPLALKAFGGYLKSKCCSNLSKWVDEIDGMVDGSSDGLDEVFDVLGKAFDGMPPKYRTIFMLLTLYMLPNMSLDKITEWMAINCNEEIRFIEKAVEDLQKKAFIEEFKPEIRIHELYMEFAQSKAEKMGRWLWWKGYKDRTREWITEDNTGFELAKLEQCMYSRIAPRYLGNLFVLQLVDVQNINTLDLEPMDRLRSVTLRDCKDLAALDGMEKSVNLAWLQIRGKYRTLKLPDLSSFQGLQYLEIHITGSEVFHQLGDLSHCFHLREINVDCPSLLEFPRLKGMQHLKKVEFSSCDKVKGALDCRGCVELQIIVLNHCCQMAASPLLSGCKKLSKLVLWECYAVTSCPDVDEPNALKTLELSISSKAASAPKYLDSFCLLENLELWNMRELMELPSFKRLSNLTVLKLANCGIRELSDLIGCDRLEHVYFFTLKNLERLPDFSLLRELKKLSLCNCTRLQCPPHIVGCHKLQMLHLLYNDNMAGLSKMDKCVQLEEIQVSWHSKDEVSYPGIDSDSCQVNGDLQFCLEYWKEEKFGNVGDVRLPEALKELAGEWMKGKKMLVKRYFRGMKLYYSLTAPYCWISNEDGQSKRCSKNLITLKIINRKMMAFPTRARDSRDWVDKVNRYFDDPLSSASDDRQIPGLDESDTTQLNSGECSESQRSTEEITSIRTNESSQSSKSTRSEDGQKFDAFLSHSGKQKDFVRQLYKDLTSQGVSCFFDEDRESLPVAENFPPRIFEAAKTCKVAILLLSKDFLESKWPMLELCAFLEAKRTTNPNLKILPLFFRISPGDLKNTEENDKKWNRLEISREKQDEWHKALRTIRPINGLRFGEGGDEVKFRAEIVKEIWQMLPTPSPRYHVRGMQGEARMCQEVANFFNVIQPNKEGIRIAGLYGIAGHGKTTLGKAFCNLKLSEFEGKAAHLEFSRGDPTQNIKFAMQYLTHRPQSYVQTLTNPDQAKIELDKRLKRQRVLLVLDNISEESIEEVAYYLKAELGKNSWILLSARSVDVLEKHFQMDKQSCMHVPRLTQDEAIAILLESTMKESILGEEDKGFALMCAKRCLFKETNCDIVPRARSFHPLALKAFGRYLQSKYGSNLSKWAAEVDEMVDRAGDGLDEVFVVLRKAFDDMPDKQRTIFMLLSVYMLPNMSPDKVSNWLAISCNEKISVIEKSVEDLCKRAFIGEFKPVIRIHDLYIEFAQSEANKMKRWLWWKEDDQDDPRGLIAEDKNGFELAKMEQCMYRRISPKYLRNLFVLQLIHVQEMGKLELGPMDRLRSITLRDCKSLTALDGMEQLSDLAWLQVSRVHRMFQLPELSILQGLQHLEIDVAGSQVLYQLGDLTSCFRLREVNVVCPSLLEFPRLKGMKHLEKVEFSLCDKVKGPLDCRDCVKLHTIVLNLCCQMAASPLLGGCKKLSKLVLSNCDAVTICPDIDVPSVLKTLEMSISSEAVLAPKNLDYCYGLENLQLWNMRELKELPSLRLLSNLTVLKLVKCGIREPPDLTGCGKLEDVYFYQLKNLEVFPNFTSLRELKKLSLCDCVRVRDPPDIEGCHKLEVFHLLYNDNMKGISKVDKCAQLEEIKVSWHCEGEVTYDGIDPDSCQVDEDLEPCLDFWKFAIQKNSKDVFVPEELKQWMKGKSMLVKKYFRGMKLYCCLTAPYESYNSSEGYSICPILLRLVHSKVMALRAPGRRHIGSPKWENPHRASTDPDWLNKVREYFDEREDIARPSGAALVASNNVEDISVQLPLSLRYLVHHMQGEARMCQELAVFFNTVHPNEKGIRIAGLYGMPGRGKTVLGKTFCNLNLSNFDGRVCHMELSGGNTLQRQKLALQYLTQFGTPNFEPGTEKDDVHYFLNTLVKRKRVLLVLDDITEESIEEVMYYLKAKWGENSWILLSARSIDLLVKHFKMDKQSCMRVPRLEEEEAIAILWERRPSVVSGFPAESRDFALECAKKCSFKEDQDYAAFHPLALKVFGRHLFCKHPKHLSNLGADIDGLADGIGDGSNGLFAVLDKALDGMDYKCRTIFVLLSRHKPPDMSTKEAFMWLAISFNERIAYIKKAVEDLCESAFIEEIKPEICIHELLKEFAQMNNKNKYDILAKPRDKIVLSPLLPPSQQRYHVPAMQGAARMCQELADFFNTVRPNEKGVRIAGLYGMPGQGKTTLGKTFCNLNLSNFNGKVCHLEFCGGNTLERKKLALQYLTHCGKRQLESLTRESEAWQKLYVRVRGQRILLVLDSITQESIDEVEYYLRTDLGEHSYVLLSARSEDVLANNFKINSKSRMSVPCLKEEEAIAILLERTSLAESALGAENRGFALHCANRCSFKEANRDIHRAAHTFRLLALKTYGRHLFSKYGVDLSQWVTDADGLVLGSGDGLDDVFIVLDKAFDYMDPKYRTIIMLLTLYMQPGMSPLNVNEWLAITCKEEMEYIEKAIEDLRQEGFIEEIEPEIRIQDLYVEFAQSKAKKMKRWFWCRRDLVTSEAGAALCSKDEAGFELANVEYCHHLDLSTIGDNFITNLWALQVVNEAWSNLRFSLMKHLRSATLQYCEYLGVLGGMENLPYLAFLQVGMVPDFKLLSLSSLNALQYLYIDIGNTREPTELGDLTGCVSLREIYVCCRSLSKFPGINGLQYLRKASFKHCDVIGPLDCSNCVKLQTIIFESCWQMAHIPLIFGCFSLSKIVFNGRDPITEYSDEDESSPLEIQELCMLSEDASAPRHSKCCDGFKNPPLWNVVSCSAVLRLRRLSNLTVLKLYECDIYQPPDVTCCSMLEEVYFFKLRYLESFPNFSSLSKLKKLCLCDCKRVRAPPDIGGCEGLEVFHLLYNDNIEKLPQMDGFPLLQEIKLSWYSSSEAVDSRWTEDNDVEFCPDYQKEGTFENLNDVYMPVELKEWEWIEGKTVRVKKYSRGEEEYYCMRAPYESDGRSGAWEQASNADSVDPVISPSAGAIC